MIQQPRRFFGVAKQLAARRFSSAGSITVDLGTECFQTHSKFMLSDKILWASIISLMYSRIFFSFRSYIIFRY